MSSSDDKSQKNRTVRGKRSSIFCSTPVLVQKARRPSSISVSAVEANSSSSAPRKSHGSGAQTVEKAPTKKRKRKQDTKARKQKRRKAVIDSDSEWETKSVQTVHEEAIPQRVSTQKAGSTSESVLFQDPGSPERVREAPDFFDDDRFESPLFRPIRRKLGSTEKIDFKENEGIQLVEDLPTFQTRVDDVDEETDTEEELILRKGSTVVTYPGKEKWDKKSEKIVECHVPLTKPWYYVATANSLWDNFVKDNHEKISKYRSRFPLSKHQENQSNEGGECSDSHKNQRSTKTVFEEWGLKTPNLSNISIARGRRSRSSKKWNRFEDVYKFPGPTDLEFEKRDQWGRRMTLNEYLRKCRMEKENLREVPSLVASQNTKGSRSPRNDLGTIQKRASSGKNRENSRVESTTQSSNADIDGSSAKLRVTSKNKPRIRAIEPVPSEHREYVQKLLEQCEKHYAD